MVIAQCSHCGKKVKVAPEKLGKKAKCPGCAQVFVLQAAPGSAAGTSSQASASHAGQQAASTPSKTVARPAAKTASGHTGARPTNNTQWYLKTADGQIYGPVPKKDLDGWVTEGRVDTQCQILRDGAERWQWASEVYPQLNQTQQPATPQPAAPQQAGIQTTPQQAVATQPGNDSGFTGIQTERPRGGGSQVGSIGGQANPYESPSPGLSRYKTKRKGGDPTAGIISIICGAVALLFLPVGCLFGPIWIGGALVALTGLVAGFMGNGVPKIIGLIINGLALLPYIVLIILMAIGLAFIQSQGGFENFDPNNLPR